MLKTALEQLDTKINATAITGLTSSACALFTAATTRRQTVSLLVVPTDADVDPMTSDTRFFFASLEGCSAPEAELAILPFPSLEVDPYRGLVPHLEVTSARAAALSALVRGKEIGRAHV